MRKRYYCDYCDKSFIDDLDARKKHLQSSYHIKQRNQHYEMFKDPKIILKEETEKSPCRRFFSNGICQFTGMCKYTHYTPDQLWEMKEQFDMQKRKESIAVPTVESWLDYYYKKDSKRADEVHISWTYYTELEHRSDLPPSLKKFDPNNFQHSQFSEWGK